MKLPIRKWPDKILTTRTTPFEFNLPEQDMIELESAMIETMIDEKGIGLAANQAGFTERFFAQKILETNECIVMFNPEIIKHSTDVNTSSEGCLSFPQLALDIERHSAIVVKYQDRHGEWRERGLAGWDARCFQHELDHLNGITFKSHVSDLKFERAAKKAKLYDYID